MLTNWRLQGETLNDLAEAANYNHWLHEILLAHAGRRVLEIGCGTGNIAEGFIKTGRIYLGVDLQEAHLRQARRRFGKQKGVSFKKIDLEKGVSVLRSFRPDTIVSVNVLEHIQDDEKVLNQCRKILSSQGKVLVFVPAMRVLYGSMDRTYGHVRRYEKEELEQKITRAGFLLETCFFTNRIGLFGWWWNGRVLKKQTIPRFQMLAYDRIFPYVMRLDRILWKLPFGLSLFCVARKP